MSARACATASDAHFARGGAYARKAADAEMNGRGVVGGGGGGYEPSRRTPRVRRGGIYVAELGAFGARGDANRSRARRGEPEYASTRHGDASPTNRRRNVEVGGHRRRTIRPHRPSTNRPSARRSRRRLARWSSTRTIPPVVWPRRICSSPPATTASASDEYTPSRCITFPFSAKRAEGGDDARGRRRVVSGAQTGDTSRGIVDARGGGGDGGSTVCV